MLTYGAAVQRWLCRRACHSVLCGLPIPGEQLVKPVDRRAPRDHPLEHIRQVGLRVEVVQLRRVDQARQDRPGPGPALTAGEECILPTKCHLGVILPISSRMSLSTIAGIPSMDNTSADITASSVPPVSSSTSRRHLAWLRSWRLGCWIQLPALAWPWACHGSRWPR